ncbi:MAG: malto-oligosyltrehalose synthase [SAR324 cluster bacterium]|nr:malto-oligosyltrehalose synthase [SAR324 cluster bacterium]
MNDTPNLILKLAELCGIQPQYMDAWNQPTEVSLETQKVILEAMEMSLNSADEIRNAIEYYENYQWNRMLPYVQVVSEHSFPWKIPVVIPVEEKNQSFEWHLLTESGEEHTGSFTPSELMVLEQQTSGTMMHTRHEFSLPVSPGLGYHQLQITGHVGMTFIVTPDRCYWPKAIEENGRIWGISVQLYSLRSARNWGIGDFTDLRWVIEYAAKLGADTVGVNPLHALFPLRPEECSPYSPSSRMFYNVMYLDVEVIEDFAECPNVQELIQTPEFQHRRQMARKGDMVNYTEVSQIKIPILELLYQNFRDKHLTNDSSRARKFREFQAQGGESLYQFALFETLSDHFFEQNDQNYHWKIWPEAYHSPSSPQILEFSEIHRERIEFFQYLQWQTSLQLEAIGWQCMRSKLGLGLYLDLAVGIDPCGFEAWVNHHLVVNNAGIGCPPDLFNTRGQDWGLAPWNPFKLKECAYAPYIQTLRKNMKYAGALRLDHVMGLTRLFWIPRNQNSAEGAYVTYPFEDLLGILKLESVRNSCLIIGEDLGTVPDNLQQKLMEGGLLSYRLLLLEKDLEGFAPPETFPPQAVVAVTTHDLPTLSGFWKGQDFVVRKKLDLFSSEKMREQMTVERSKDRALLLQALSHENLLPEDVELDPAMTPVMTPDLSRALHRYLARTPCKIVMVQMDDVLGQIDQVNQPGTQAVPHNWRKKLSEPLENIRHDSRFHELSMDMALERKKLVLEIEQPATEASRWSMKIPLATYRLQFNNTFTFKDATALIPYLRDLGISHCYASPYLRARTGSPHGYDIVNHNELNPELGTSEDFQHYVNQLHQHGMGQILDIVPNHMGIMGADNAWWKDVLENGPVSLYADFFDIEWEPLKKELLGKVLVPVLGNHYGLVLENGELNLRFNAETGEFNVFYYKHQFPVAPREYNRILRHRLQRLESHLGMDHHYLLQFKSLLSALEHLPDREMVLSLEQREERNRDKELLKSRLAELCAEATDIRLHVDLNVNEFNGRPGEPESFEALHHLLEVQSYRLSHWLVAGSEINYRRFFDINELIGLRMENDFVFDATHGLILKFIRENQLDGLRLDHPDGLYNPLQYFRRLTERIRQSLETGNPEEIVPDMPAYIVAEKILADYERLPQDWPVHGTTGYDFASLVNGLFVDSKAEKSMTEIYHQFIGRRMDCSELLYQCKKLIMKVSLASELNVLANQIIHLCESDWKTRDYTLNEVRHALMEILACFPVYRTYVTENHVSETDEQYVNWAVAKAKKKCVSADTGIYDFIRDVLLLQRMPTKPEAVYQKLMTHIAMRFQQYSSVVMAKSFEDTVFYIYNRLTSLNEVGGDPRNFGVSLKAFHHLNEERMCHWPHSMLSTSTHDAKRGEDLRMRLHVLSEIPEEWQENALSWQKLNAGRKQDIEGQICPDSNDEYLLYQTLLGAWPVEPMTEKHWPVFIKRIQDYMLKAVREAKVFSAWINPDLEYEAALMDFIHELLSPPEQSHFLKRFLPFQQKVAWMGYLNSLSQAILKLTVPGVPDIYQGCEGWNLSLVDPDNRRPVDFKQRQQNLSHFKTLEGQSATDWIATVQGFLENLSDFQIKQFVIWRILQLRNTLNDLFRSGQYHPLQISGQYSGHVCAFSRTLGTQTMIVVVPIFFAALSEGGKRMPLGHETWKQNFMELPGEPATGKYRNIFTQEYVSVEDKSGQSSLELEIVLKHFPWAVLIQES